MNQLTYRLTSAFPFLLIFASLLSLFYPGLFTWFRGTSITIGLGIIMLGMGITLKLEDFKRIYLYPSNVLLGIGLQYTAMPISGWTIAHIFNLPPEFATGIILVSCCPGGTASNVITYIAKADVALSVTMTSFSTIFAVVLTPILTSFLADSTIAVNGWGLFYSTLNVVIVPIVCGVLLNQFFPKVTTFLMPASPAVAVFMIVLIVASIIGSSSAIILEHGLQLIAAVMSLHVSGFFLGYVISKMVIKDKIVSRTISIEVGMQNSGLGVVLAKENFTSPMVAVPSAISSLFHSIIGSILSGIWRRN
ncbi:MAG: bile acid:sodium symporter family protein [Leptospiraceae bacterium]|nr:bile acid:sodium symporter family protein [Leptospiraceae bacterium]MCP5496798.1 bile acid:sodium symporter family protein [Leptospiraceae bacterium]